MAHPVIVPETLSYETFLATYAGTHAEWENGQVISMTPVSPRNQWIANFLVAIFQHFCDVHQAGWVLSAPVQLKLKNTGREPDVMVVTPEHRDRIKRTYVEGPADLVVEIVSPESRTRDRRVKLREYEAAGVREYWILDPERRQPEFYTLGEAGKYEPLPIEEGIFRSMVLPGLWLKVEWLWQEPLPSLMSVLREWKLVTGD